MDYRKKIIVGSRESPLAVAQADIFFKKLKNLLGKKYFKKLEQKFFKTSGDKFLEKKISTLGNKGLFTKEIDEAQLNFKIDIGVHSLKDLPTKLPQGLIIGAVLKRDTPNDLIMTREKVRLKDLKKNAVVGTSSIRRTVQLKKLRPDVEIKEIRGNVGTRINKLKNGEFDAIILAHAGLKRLKINEHFEKIDIKKMIPSPGQGVIAIVIRENDNLLNFLENLNDTKTLIESECERNFLSALDGSCKTPIGALARLEVKAKSKILFHYMVASEDGEKFIKDKTYFEIDNYCKMSFDLGQKIKKML
ncbi:MAG: hydroxymethylbilane synthase [Rickettsiales bacterium]|nr:hydroxymethylbilane synthase [Rickettsiales bacterium]RPG12850.1 MAG: hydroxymethylbilane synthase [Pelagibacteraceae bacterium TMED195]|tara:strand:+ start:8902 stop:9813 length:912 start_codon:yes stop_codon:yes gene_type:complete